jgi:hypothetical protein
MAEIPIERKKSTNWLPLIIGALVVLALLGWWASRNRDDRDTSAITSDTSATAARDTTSGRPR